MNEMTWGKSVWGIGYFEEPTVDSLGTRVRTIRKESKLTQTQLADRLELSIETVKSIELDRVKPSIETLIKICRLFDVSADYLLGLKEERK